MTVFACLTLSQPTIITFALEWLNGLFECYRYKYCTRIMIEKIMSPCKKTLDHILKAHSNIILTFSGIVNQDVVILTDRVIYIG